MDCYKKAANANLERKTQFTTARHVKYLKFQICQHSEGRTTTVLSITYCNACNVNKFIDRYMRGEEAYQSRFHDGILRPSANTVNIE